MTKVPVDEAPAGPHMDAAVAEALGWLPYESDGRWYWKDMSDDDFPYWNHHANGYGFVEDLKPWSPSTDIAAAWELAPSVLNGKHLVFMYTHWTIWHFDKDEYDNMPDDAIGETAPLAICRAFLKTSGVEHLEIGE